MRLNKTVGLLAGTTALTLSGVCFGNTDEANTDALAQIAELKAELAAMKAQNGETWLTEQRADQIRGIVQDVLADAETRSSLQSTGANAGYDNGFFISSADGNFSMKINGLVQFRWIFNGSTDSYNDGAGTVYHDRWGFDVRRARVDFSGTLAQDWKYMFQIQYGSPFGNAAEGSSLGGDVNVLEAYLERDVELAGTTFSLRGGQFKAPFLREWLVDDGDQLAVDRSLLSWYFYQGYSTGLQLGYESDMFRAAVAYTNGLNTPAQTFVQLGNNTPTLTNGSYNTSWVSNPTRYSFAGRVDVKLSGNWADFDNFSSRPGTEAGIMVGVAGFYQAYNDAFAGQGAQNSNVGGATADITWNFGGASIFAAFVWENVNAIGQNANPWGFVVQGGYFLSDDLELFGRYSYANSAVPYTGNAVVPGVGSEVTKLSVVTVGVNYFLSSNVKLTADFGWSFNDIGAFAATSAGYQGTQYPLSNQYAIRTQLQLSF